MQRAVLLAVVLATIACSQRSQPAIQRVAVLPFENLSGDAALDWVAEAAPSMVVFELTGAPATFPMRVLTLRDAYLQRATRFLHGYVTRHGAALRFEIQLEDAGRHKMAATREFEGTVAAAMNGVAAMIDPGARAFSTTDAAAIEAWGRRDFERAVTLDPDFGAAWVVWVETLGADRAQASAVAARALSRPSLRSAVERAQLVVLSAGLGGDGEARLAALAALVKLTPNDAASVRALGDSEMGARRFRESAAAYRRLAVLDPADGQPLNQLGYAEALAGNLDAARTALEDYRLYQDPNALDSLGEVHFMAGRFAEAEKYFIQAHDKNAAFLQGADLLKAAYARWLQSLDPKNGGDALVARYLQFRAGVHDPNLAWREAVWLYATGRREQALEKVKGAPSVADVQVSVWNGTVKDPGPLGLLVDHKAAEALDGLKTLYQRSQPSNDSLPRVFYAWALSETGRKDEARALLTRWPLPGDESNPLFESLVFPKFLELRRELGIK